MGKGNWLTSKRMKECWGLFFFFLILVWDIVKLIQVLFNTWKEGEYLGPSSSKNRKAIAVKFSGIKYCLFIYTHVNK